MSGWLDQTNIQDSPTMGSKEMRKRPLGMMGYYKGDSNHWTTYDWYRPDTRPASRQGSDVHRGVAVTPASSSPMTVEVDYDELSDDASVARALRASMSEPRAGVSNFLAQQLKLVLVSAGFNAKQIKQARVAHALGPQMETVTKKGSDIPTVVVTKERRRHRRRRGNHGAPAGSEENEKGLSPIFTRFAENCSMQGALYILVSSSLFSKTVWSLLLIAAIGVMGLHLYQLFCTYLAYPTTNSISLGFSSLQFPAITVCNVNAVRKSQVSLLSQKFQSLVNASSPDNLASSVQSQAPSSTHGNNRRRKKREGDSGEQSFSLGGYNFGLNLDDFTEREKPANNYYKSLPGYSSSWESEGEDATLSAMSSTFQELLASESRELRLKVGHQISDMLVSCAFSGKQCHSENFTSLTSSTFGNCFTLQYDKFVSKASGPSGGLELIFFVQTDEYIRGWTADEGGLQVVVHPYNTMPFPDDEGFAVGGGSSTFVSMRMVNVDRKGPPYGTCTDTDSFFKKYNVIYTRQTCQKICEQSAVHSLCGCRDETQDQLNFLMDALNLLPCRNLTEMVCMKAAQWNYSQGLIDCPCNNPCSDTKYEKTLSLRPWPQSSFADLLVQTICRKKGSSVCQQLQSKQTDARALSHEFLKLNIFFEDLNYQNLSEEVAYEDVQFLSDVGGSVGLWIGLSILSIFEILQLAGELMGHFLCCKWREPVSPR